MKNNEENSIGGEEYFQMLNNAIDNLDKIEEIGTIYCKKTPSSPIHIEENCVGIENWAGKIIFQYSYREMFRRRNNDDKFDAWEPTFYLRVMEVSRSVLLFCNDCTTAWNNRKRVLSVLSQPSQPPPTIPRQFVKEQLMKELQFGRCILRRNPKSGETFAHRRWLLLHFNLICCHGDNMQLMTADERQRIFEYELKLCTDTADWHPSNYHAWSYRIWLISQILNNSELKDDKKKEILSKELDEGCEFIEMHLTDHSPVAYVSNILKKLMLQYPNEEEEWVKIWKKIFLHCTSLQLQYQNFQSLWKYRRCLMLLIEPYLSTNTSHLFPSLEGEVDFCKQQGDTETATAYYKYIKKFVFNK